MTGNEKALDPTKLTGEQERERYWVETCGGNVLVWHHNNQLALLLPSPDIQKKVQDLIERNRKELKEIEARTGWKANQ